MIWCKTTDADKIFDFCEPVGKSLTSFCKLKFAGHEKLILQHNCMFFMNDVGSLPDIDSIHKNSVMEMPQSNYEGEMYELPLIWKFLGFSKKSRNHLVGTTPERQHISVSAYSGILNGAVPSNIRINGDVVEFEDDDIEDAEKKNGIYIAVFDSVTLSKVHAHFLPETSE